MEKILISLITVFVLAMLPAESAILPGTVCVTEAAPRISSSKLTMIKGQSRTLKITGLKKGQKITWKSSNSKIVTVNKAGKLQAKAKGSCHHYRNRFQKEIHLQSHCTGPETEQNLNNSESWSDISAEA